MMTYDRNRNPITVGSRVMVNGSRQTGTITAINGNGLNAQQLRRANVVTVEGVKEPQSAVELIRLGMH